MISVMSEKVMIPDWTSLSEKKEQTAMTEKPISIHISDDYAVLHAGKYRFYYGYEYTDEDDNWQFVIRKNKNIVLQVTPKLPKGISKWQCGEVLLYCIGGYIYKEKI